MSYFKNKTGRIFDCFDKNDKIVQNRVAKGELFLIEEAEAEETPVEETLETPQTELEALKLEAKELGISGWGSFKDTEKLKAKIEDAKK